MPEVQGRDLKRKPGLSQHPAQSCVCFLTPASTNPWRLVKFKATWERPLGPPCSVSVSLSHPHPCFSRPRACAHLQGCAKPTNDQERRPTRHFQQRPALALWALYLWARQALNKPAYLQTYTLARSNHFQRTLTHLGFANKHRPKNDKNVPPLTLCLLCWFNQKA